MAKPKPPYDRKLYEQAKVTDNKLWIRLKRAADHGDAKQLEKLSHKYLTSFHVKFRSVVDAYRGMNRHDRPKSLDFEGTARSLNLFEPDIEPVVLLPKPKGGNVNDVRPVLNFGIRRRAAQQIARELLKSQFTPHPHQFGLGNGGRNKLCDIVLGLLNDGYTAYVEIDIRRCYNSFDAQHIGELLQIPKEVTEHHVLGRNLTLTLHRNYRNWISNDADLSDPDALPFPIADTVIEAREGIPQGSLASSIVSEYLLKSVFADIGDDALVFNYADNFLILGKSEQDVVATTLALEEALQRHPAGPLPLKMVQCGEAYARPIEFLGCEFHKSKMGFKARPTAKNLAKFKNEIAGVLKTLHNTKIKPSERMKVLINAKSKIQSWRAAFPSWEKSYSVTMPMLIELTHIKNELKFEQSSKNDEVISTPLKQNVSQDMQEVLF